MSINEFDVNIDGYSPKKPIIMTTEYIHKLELELHFPIAIKFLEKASFDGIQCEAIPVEGGNIRIDLIYPEQQRAIVFRRYIWLLEELFSND